MRAAQPLMARGFFGRTYQELKRRSTIAVNLEAVKGPSGPRQLYDWHSAENTRDCVIMADDLIGGQSTSHLDFVSDPSSSSASTSSISSSSSPAPPSYARFHGTISTALPPDQPTIKRSGYAAFRTPDQSMTLFGRSFWDIDPYSYLAIRLKSDGRAYFINLQSDSIEPTDLHQHRLFAKRPGEWETVVVRWNDFVRTNFGFVVEPQADMLRQKVRTLGIGLTDRVEGPFELCIERMWATNDKSEGDHVVEAGEGGLKTRGGKNVHW